MRDIHLTVSEEQSPYVQVTPYHPHNSVNLPRHLLHSTLHLLLGGDGLGHLYIHYTTMVIPFEQRNVIDYELPHRTINSCSLYHDNDNTTKKNVLKAIFRKKKLDVQFGITETSNDQFGIAGRGEF